MRSARSLSRMDVLRRRLGAPLAILIAAALAVIAPQACAACSCIALTFGQAADQAEVIFVGTVTGQEGGRESELGPAVDVTFEVSEVYAGSVGSEAVVSTADNSAACGFAFEQGQTYLVMAGTTATGLETNLCTGTALASGVAADDLASLGASAAPSGGDAGGGDAGAGGAAGGASESGSLGLIIGGATLGALLAGLLVWWQRRRPGTGTPADEDRRRSSGEVLPHTEAT